MQTLPTESLCADFVELRIGSNMSKQLPQPYIVFKTPIGTIIANSSVNKGRSKFYLNFPPGYNNNIIFDILNITDKKEYFKEHHIKYEFGNEIYEYWPYMKSSRKMMRLVNLLQKDLDALPKRS